MGNPKQDCGVFSRGVGSSGAGLSKFILSAAAALALGAATADATAAPGCSRWIEADVVAFELSIPVNRFGSFMPAGMMYALRRDVRPIDPALGLVPGNVKLRSDKRPRPLVLRANEGDCVQVTFTNLLAHERPIIVSPEGPEVVDPNEGPEAPELLPASDAPATRSASIHAEGVDYVDGIASDGSFVGNNSNSLAAPGETRVYRWYANRQGQHRLISLGAVSGGEGDNGQSGLGLYGALNVEPTGAKWYRSQVTSAILAAATIGRNANNTPRINYEKTDAEGVPLLNMLRSLGGNRYELVHSDVNAVITDFSEDCANAPYASTCGQAFREFTVIFHDEMKVVQGYPLLDKPVFSGVRDAMGINYGAQGAGSPVVASRLKLNALADCAECKYEEFFLTSWATGDPAMIVQRDGSGRAVQALYADDPSNVHHSYLSDPVRFRNLHVGYETHIFHLHAHQWLHSPRDPESNYLDSQTLSPGSGFTYEIAYGGSGNRNLTAGDSIFHCHLYPHFAQGLWSLWRVHDVFEAGTSDRKLPDAEIAGGTPSPALVPIPDLPMAPMPSRRFMGYPFYIAGQAGHRPPQAPLDLEWDGGLPRHRIASAEVVDGEAAVDPALAADPIHQRVRAQNPDPDLVGMARKLHSAKLELLPNDGTADEKTAMLYHQGKLGISDPAPTRYGWPARGYRSFTARGVPGPFRVNGTVGAAGAPYANPCMPGAPQRRYRISLMQFDMPINKDGWHDPQARIYALDEDVQPLLAGTKQPEPLFFRANSEDCIVANPTNLIPGNLNLDDYTIYTPTDTIGNHIHLVKFDVTASDGSANGWNYEDGTFSPDEVRERIEANNAWQQAAGGSQILHPKAHPVHSGRPEWLGAQTTTQRWYADPLINNAGVDRTIRTVFTHDHFGPSSHQQHGLYAGLLIEPKGSQWTTLDGTPMHTRVDGGPTSWAASILKGGQGTREFALQWGDWQTAYTKDGSPVNPPARKTVPLPKAIEYAPMPIPQAISLHDPGTMVINYRHESLALRLARKDGNGDPVRGSDGLVELRDDAGGDLANVFSTLIHGDPQTPILAAYEGDRVQVRSLQGSQEEQHVLNIHGMKWLVESSSENSGYTSSQPIGISEHMEFEIGAMPDMPGRVNDYFYGSTPVDDVWNGMWGVLRAHQGLVPGLAALPDNPDGRVAGKERLTSVCPAGAPLRSYTVRALRAADVLQGGTLVYNGKFGLHDPNAVLYIRAGDEEDLMAGLRKPEPLVLRAAAGDCIRVTLENGLPPVLADGPDAPQSWSWNLLPPIVDGFNFNQVRMSSRIGLTPQLVSYIPSRADGAAVGRNPRSDVAPGASRTYEWYAGDLKLDETGAPIAAPIEFGATNLRSMADAVKHGAHGAVGALIVEPQGATWDDGSGSRLSADIRDAAGNLLFREFVVMRQSGLALFQDGAPLPNYAAGDDGEDTGGRGFNFGTEPLWARLGVPPLQAALMHDRDYTNVFSSLAPNPGCPSGACGDPETMVFEATANTPVRFRVLDAYGRARQSSVTLAGHNWQRAPWASASTVQGHNPLSWQTAEIEGFGPARHSNWLTTAGGLFGVPGDYLLRGSNTQEIAHGGWGIFRVLP